MYEREGWLLTCRRSAQRLFVGVDQSVPATEEVVMLQGVYFVIPDVPQASNEAYEPRDCLNRSVFASNLTMAIRSISQPRGKGKRYGQEQPVILCL
jgi:hypothetical protein